MSAIQSRIEEIDAILNHKEIPMQTETQATSHAQPPYTPSSRVRKQIDTNFRYHVPQNGQQERYVAIRDKAREFAELIASTTPESREQSMALSDLENCVMWANAAIARNENPETPTV